MAPPVTGEEVNAPLSGFKGSVAEGGMRVPALMRWKGTIPPGVVCGELATTMDILPTLACVSKAELPTKPIDGENIIALMLQEENSKSPHQVFYYYQVDQLQALRVGDWKLYLPLEAKQINVHNDLVEKVPARLYHLRTDIRELKNLAELFPEKVTELLSYAVQARKELGDRGKEGTGQRKAAINNNPTPLLMN
jgi:arylsulfatase A-like enzyme